MTNMITKAGDRLIPPIVDRSFMQTSRHDMRKFTVTVDKHAPAMRESHVDKLLGPRAGWTGVWAIHKLQYERWKQPYEILLFGILHVEDKVLKGIRKPRTNGECFFHIANADTVYEAVQGDKAQDSVQKFRTRRVHVRYSQVIERALVLGDLKGTKQKTGEDLLALVPHVVPVLDRDPSQDLVHRGNAYLHSTSPGPCMRSRSS
jgi:hypothetical protein